MLQAHSRASDVNDGIQFYVAVRVATDSQFPFDPGDPCVIRVVDDALVISPPDDPRDSIDLPPIDDDIRRAATQSQSESQS